MAPNPFGLVKKVFNSSPQNTPSPPESPAPRSQSIRRTEHWDEPVPGLYEYLPGRGWYLIKRDSASEGEKLKREPVLRCPILHRWILRADREERTRTGKAIDQSGTITTKRFFKSDDPIAWINCWDKDGAFIPGPWERWCIDEKTGMFRKMLHGDDPEWRNRKRGSKSTQGGTSGQVSRVNSFTNVP
ncbi:MAG: hypothetical protein M4579_002492 [Chaenotheca gracillima]|nr:MAG: hypothetical protein M4579_002492 [Chaenotheca gracillima]